MKKAMEVVKINGIHYETAVLTMRRLGITEATMRSWHRQGLEPVWLGGRKYFNPETVDAWIIARSAVKNKNPPLT